jgi:polar amino acid transport system substrate-binding protein
MRTYLGLPLVVLSALALGGCAPGSDQEDGTSGASGEGDPLVVAADVGFAPHAMARPDGTVEGFNVDLAAEIARRLGRPGYEVLDQEWSGMFPGLAARRFEFIIAPVTVTYERSEEVLFVEGYLDTDYTFLVRTEAPDITSLEDIRGQSIAVNNGSAYDIWATENRDTYDLEIQRYGKNADAVQAVVTGRAFANLSGHTVAAWAARQSPAVRTTYTIDSGGTFSAAFRHDDVAFRNQVEEILECMKLDGTLAELHQKWFDTPPAEGSAVVTVLEGYGEPGTVGYDPTPHTLSCN